MSLRHGHRKACSILGVLLLLLIAGQSSGAVQDRSSPLPGTAIPNEALMVRSVYASAGKDLLWVRQGQPTPQALELIHILRCSDLLGLRPTDYSAESIAGSMDRLATLHSGDPASIDRLLVAAAVRFISHVHYGRIDPQLAGFELGASRADLDVVGTVAGMSDVPSVAAIVSAAEPHFYHYQLLKTALARYRLLSADPTLGQLPGIGRRNLRSGDAYPGAAALRRLLASEGDLAEAPAAISPMAPRLDADLAQGLSRYQLRHGLSVDGTLNAATYAALNTPLARRVRQIELTLERWRWLPPFTSPPIIVNIPEFRLFAFDSTADRAASILQMPVIVGQVNPSKRTPIFLADMRYVVFRPYWDVPRSITVRELLPKIQANPNYLAHEHLEMVQGSGDDAPVVPLSRDALAELAAGKLRLRQQPGNDNALGLIKFVFPNAHDVYLHSTPARQLFAASRRTFSHGCIRVSDPKALALHVLRNASEPWDEARIGAAMDSDTKKPLRVELRQPIRVMILYGTAMATEAGPVQFFDDIYGHDRRLETLLGLGPAE
jgi:murein L,D-transpeptidase YcbB/YkuD